MRLPGPSCAIIALFENPDKWRGDCSPGVKSEGKRGKFDFLALVEMFGCWVRFLPPHLYKSGGWLG